MRPPSADQVHLGVGLALAVAEQAEQARELAGLGCRWAQGYHFSRPVAAADMARLAGRPASAAPGQPAVAALPHPA
jgi:EAL domain-containing protein (putative c-di-GMP-specific phosphodiesterase class I)